MQPAPNLGEEGFLAAELHLRAFLVVSVSRSIELCANVLGALSASHHVVVEDVEGLGGVREGLDGGGEESSGTVAAKAVTAGQAGKTCR